MIAIVYTLERAAAVKRKDKPEFEKDRLAIRMRLGAGLLRQANKSQDELRIADLLEAGAERIEDLETRLRKRRVS
jgi:hypothetical protein